MTTNTSRFERIIKDFKRDLEELNNDLVLLNAGYTEHQSFSMFYSNWKRHFSNKEELKQYINFNITNIIPKGISLYTKLFEIDLVSELPDFFIEGQEIYKDKDRDTIIENIKEDIDNLMTSMSLDYEFAEKNLGLEITDDNSQFPNRFLSKF